MIEVWFDGAISQNPGGFGGYGFLVKEDGKLLCDEAGPLGDGPTMTNNVAEYRGLLAAFECLIRQGHQNSQILVRGDSKLVIDQMRGKWPIKKDGGVYVPVALEVQELSLGFRHLNYEWIPREENKEADVLSKEGLAKNEGYVPARREGAAKKPRSSRAPHHDAHLLGVLHAISTDPSSSLEVIERSRLALMAALVRLEKDISGP